MKFSQNHVTRFLCLIASLPCQDSMVFEQLSVTVGTPCSASVWAPVPGELPAGLPHLQSVSVALAKAKAFLEP